MTNASNISQNFKRRHPIIYLLSRWKIRNLITIILVDDIYLIVCDRFWQFHYKMEVYEFILVITVIRLIEDASLIEDAPQLQPSFPCNKLWVMMMGKLPNWRRTSSLEHFMRNIWSLSSQCLGIKVEFRNNYNATNSWECLSHIFECQITILTGKKSPFSMYFLSFWLGDRTEGNIIGILYCVHVLL